MEERRTTVTRTEPTVVRDEVSSTNVTTTDDSGFSWGVFAGAIVVAAVLAVALLMWHPWSSTSTFTSSNTTTNSTIDQNSGTTSGSTSTGNGTKSTTTSTTNGSTSTYP